MFNMGKHENTHASLMRESTSNAVQSCQFLTFNQLVTQCYDTEYM